MDRGLQTDSKRYVSVKKERKSTANDQDGLEKRFYLDKLSVGNPEMINIMNESTKDTGKLSKRIRCYTVRMIMKGRSKLIILRVITIFIAIIFNSNVRLKRNQELMHF